MTVVNPKSISGINSITTGSGSDNLLTIHTSDASSTERVRINSSGDVIVGSGITVSPDGDIFATGVTTATTFSGSGASLTNLPAANITGTLPAISGANLTALNASNIGSGTVPTARLGSGTASSSTFLRGDSTFAAVTSTTINNNGDNKIISGSGTANTLEAESNLHAVNGRLLIGTSSEQTLPYTSSGAIQTLGAYNTSSINIVNNENSGNTSALTFNKIRGASGSAGGTDVMGGINWGAYDGSAWRSGITVEGRLTSIGSNAVPSKLTFKINSGSSNTERFAITPNGVTFNGDTAAANALDDYEEGTFTPNWDAGGGVTFSYNHQYGFYTKIGDTVTFQLYIMGYASTITGGNDANGVVIQGLPYTILNHSRYYPAFTIGRTYNVQINDNKRLYSYGDSNSTNIRLIQEENDTTGGLLTAVQLDRNPCFMLVGGVYRV